MRDSVPVGESKKGDFLYLNIYKELKREINEGLFKKGDPFPPERQLKDRFGTTHVTVRNALSLLVEEGYIERYSGRGTFVIYESQSPISQIKQSSNLKSVQFIIRAIDSYFTNLIKDLSNEITFRNINFKISVYYENSEREKKLLSQVISDEDSFLVYEPSQQGLCSLIHQSMANRVLLINSPDQESGLPEIRHDFVGGARDSVNFLNQLGHDKIAFIGWEQTNLGVLLHKGYQNGLEELGIPLNPTLQGNGMGLQEGGFDACRRILKAHPSCRSFLCANDLSAGGVINYMKTKGLELGADYTVIGCGNNPFSEVLGLSSLDLNSSRIRQICQTLLVEYIEYGSIEMLNFDIKTDLILRKYFLYK